jgi:hypothetical protein
MSDGSVVRAATLDRFVEAADQVQGVCLSHLPPFTTLLVQTRNSLYRVVITRWPEVCIQGGAFFPEPTSAFLDGSGGGGSSVRVGWIGVGLVLEIRSEGRRILTSRIRAISTE